MFGVEEEQIDKLSAEIEKLKAENLRLREALEKMIPKLVNCYPEAEVLAQNILAICREALKGGADE